MKNFIKKIVGYNKLYPIIKSSSVYKIWKRLNGKIAIFLSGNPSKDFFVIGITGTNGKTTTANLIHKLLNDTVAKTAMISTANIKIGNKEIVNDTKMTSLDVFDLHSMLATAKNAGCKIAILEVSSHGLEQNRFEGIDFDVAVLTNITHDHLDYHKSIDHYANAKKKLFKYVLYNGKTNKFAVFPRDDKYGKKREDEMAFDKKVSFALHTSATLKSQQINETATGTQFNFNYLGNNYLIQTPLVGSYNVSNILAALAVGIQMGIPIDQAIQSIEEFKGISGRMENIHFNGINFFVDFAHSPDALEKVLTFLKNVKGAGRIITLFGAPGNRDTFKRPIMGEIAEKYSDIIIATDDDPDTENRLKILSELTQKIKRDEGNNFYIIPDRSLAIKMAVEISQPGDIVLLAGKGHETVQRTNFGTKSWNDKQELIKHIEQVKTKQNISLNSI